tara:strand:+ start:1167 stop:1385 length:219 start_codon:yes stop_codon:yes gene_type:complete
MSNNQAKIMGSVTQTVRFIIAQVQTNLLEDLTNPASGYDLTNDQAVEIVRSLESTINTAYQRSMDEIIRAIG